MRDANVNVIQYIFNLNVTIFIRIQYGYDKL